MLMLGNCVSIRSERRLCEEEHLNLAYRFFCRLDPSDSGPDQATFSENRPLFPRRRTAARPVRSDYRQCIEEGLVSGQRVAIDASLIDLASNKQSSTPKAEWGLAQLDPAVAVREYLDTLDEAAFAAASEVQSQFTSYFSTEGENLKFAVGRDRPALCWKLKFVRPSQDSLR